MEIAVQKWGSLENLELHRAREQAKAGAELSKVMRREGSAGKALQSMFQATKQQVGLSKGQVQLAQTANCSKEVALVFCGDCHCVPCLRLTRQP